MVVLVTIPDATDLDGAVVELSAGESPFQMWGEVRIPAPTPPPTD
jgi:hypothetical protein